MAGSYKLGTIDDSGNKLSEAFNYDMHQWPLEFQRNDTFQYNWVYYNGYTHGHRVYFDANEPGIVVRRIATAPVVDELLLKHQRGATNIGR